MDAWCTDTLLAHTRDNRHTRIPERLERFGPQQGPGYLDIVGVVSATDNENRAVEHSRKCLKPRNSRPAHPARPERYPKPHRLHSISFHITPQRSYGFRGMPEGSAASCAAVD